MGCRVPNALPGRGSVNVEIFGMAGVPEGAAPGITVPIGKTGTLELLCALFAAPDPAASPIGNCSSAPTALYWSWLHQRVAGQPSAMLRSVSSCEVSHANKFCSNFNLQKRNQTAKELPLGKA